MARTQGIQPVTKSPERALKQRLREGMPPREIPGFRRGWYEVGRRLVKGETK